MEKSLVLGGKQVVFTVTAKAVGGVNLESIDKLANNGEAIETVGWEELAAFDDLLRDCQQLNGPQHLATGQALVPQFSQPLRNRNNAHGFQKGLIVLAPRHRNALA